MGAIISVLDNRVIHITGVDRLEGYRHRAIPDRLEAASWACAALATGGDILVRGALQGPMMTFLNVFRRVGGAFEVDDTPSSPGIRFWHPGGPLSALALETDVHPGFQTDWQQPMVVALTQAQGLSIVHETVYEKRLGFTKALTDMGAQIQLYRECLGGTPCRFGQRNFMHSAVISGPTKLHATDLVIPDLRAGFSYLIAALAAQGTSSVHGISLINRGYEDFGAKLAGLGAQVEFPS
jgi:UDP-N-acetylglucosamine 1-carboxyvinyltransferase